MAGTKLHPHYINIVSMLLSEVSWRCIFTQIRMNASHIEQALNCLSQTTASLKLQCNGYHGSGYHGSLLLEQKSSGSNTNKELKIHNKCELSLEYLKQFDQKYNY